ncbi:hypothetical protein [Streptomyces sp. CA-111067]|uniref:hypothetical protein n=1 Tax=Streptomyces sp. CA-111067 TaxID=3240046 RepID=UPI003D98DBEE
MRRLLVHELPHIVTGSTCWSTRSTYSTGHPASPERKLEAFALLSGLTALFVQNETAATDTGTARRAAYLRHVAAAGSHPRITALLAGSPADGNSVDRFDAVLLRALTGVLG